jgi:hypothetical protein
VEELQKRKGEAERKAKKATKGGQELVHVSEKNVTGISSTPTGRENTS